MSELTEPLYYSIHPLVCPLVEEQEVGRYSDDLNCVNDSTFPDKDLSSFELNNPNFHTVLRVVTLLFLVMCSCCLIYIWLLLIKMSNKINEVKEYEIDKKIQEVEDKREVECPNEENEKSTARPRNTDYKYSSPLRYGFGDNNYKKSCKLSEMIISFVNVYMNDWYKKITKGDETIKKWHPYLMTNDIELFGYIMVRIMNTKINDISNGKMEYIAVILSSAIFHGLLRGSKQVMEDIKRLCTIRLPVNCVSTYKIKQIRTYDFHTLTVAYENHVSEVRRIADEKAKVEYFDKQMEMDKIRMYNEELKKLVLCVLAEINWNTTLRVLSRIYAGFDKEENESDYCISPRRDSADTEDEREIRRSHL